MTQRLSHLRINFQKSSVLDHYYQEIVLQHQITTSLQVTITDIKRSHKCLQNQVLFFLVQTTIFSKIGTWFWYCFEFWHRSAGLRTADSAWSTWFAMQRNKIVNTNNKYKNPLIINQYSSNTLYHSSFPIQSIHHTKIESRFANHHFT
jgi:hypothetical protein